MPMLDRYDPFARLQTLQDTLRGVFEDSPWTWLDASRGTTWVPRCDVYEDNERLVFKFELPEVRKEDLSLRVENGVLTLEGSRNLEFTERKENYHRIERTYGKFARSFSLPDTVAVDGMDAEFKNGVLRVTLTKKPEAVARTVTIKE